MPTVAVWQIRAGANAALADFALEQGVVAIGWDDVPDLKRFDSRGELKQVLGRVYVNESLHAIAIWAGELWRFANSIRQNDIVFMPRQDRRYLAVGTDVGPYEYRADFPQGARHTRGITWLEREFPRTALPPPMRRSVKARLTVAQVGNRYAAERMRRLLT